VDEKELALIIRLTALEKIAAKVSVSKTQGKNNDWRIDHSIHMGRCAKIHITLYMRF
jgi:hypothetical protein